MTDNKAVTSIMNRKIECDIGNNRVNRWLIALLSYQFKIILVPSKQNVAADYLTRAETQEDNVFVVEKTENKLVPIKGQEINTILLVTRAKNENEVERFSMLFQQFLESPTKQLAKQNEKIKLSGQPLSLVKMMNIK